MTLPTRMLHAVLLILLVGAFVTSTLIVSVSAYTSVDVGTAYNMITGGAFPNLVILDVRTTSAYDSGHIYGAISIPVADLPSRIGELASHLNDPILVYCSCGCVDSPTASGILDSNNFTEVYKMSGGINAWKAAGYPTWINPCTLTIKPTTGGSADPSPGTYIFEYGTEVHVNATSYPGYYLDGWELDNVYVGMLDLTGVVMNQNHTLQAVFMPLDSGHNIATKWIASKTIVFQGANLSIRVTVINTGSYSENSSVTANINSTSITPQNVTLDSGACTTLTFTLNTSSFPYGNYTIWAYSWPVPGETDTADNNFTGGWVFVSMIGDLTGAAGVPDGKCDIRDLAVVAKCFGSISGMPNWNANCDANNDGKVDIRDIAIVAKHFGESTQYP